MCRKIAFFGLRAEIILSSDKVSLDSRAGPFLGVWRNIGFSEKYSPLDLRPQCTLKIWIVVLKKYQMDQKWKILCAWWKEIQFNQKKQQSWTAGVGWMLCINSAILLPWVQQKYDLPKNEKYCVLGGKKSDATRKSWKLFSTPPTLGGGRGGEGCSLPVAHQSGRSTILNISDLFVNVLRVFLILTEHWGRRSAPHLWEGLDRPLITMGVWEFRHFALFLTLSAKGSWI